MVREGGAPVSLPLLPVPTGVTAYHPSALCPKDPCPRWCPLAGCAHLWYLSHGVHRADLRSCPQLSLPYVVSWHPDISWGSNIYVRISGWCFPVSGLCWVRGVPGSIPMTSPRFSPWRSACALTHPHWNVWTSCGSGLRGAGAQCGKKPSWRCSLSGSCFCCHYAVWPVHVPYTFL